MDPQVFVTNLVDYTSLFNDVIKYLQLIFYALVIIIVLNVIKGV